MNNGILTIFKKEMKRFFGDRRMLISIVSSGVIIYLLYTVMGSAMYSLEEEVEDTPSIVYAVNTPESINILMESSNIDIVDIDASELKGIQDKIILEAANIAMVFPENFDVEVDAYNPLLGTPAPQIEIYYNSTYDKSLNLYIEVTTILNSFEAQVTNLFDINTGDGVYNLASEEDAIGVSLASFIPMLLMIFSSSGCITIAPESIAGEKERGTIATILTSPVKRSDIALGKVLAISVISLISGMSSAVGTIAALPKLMGEVADELEIPTNLYSIKDYILLVTVILSIVILIVSMTSVMSAYAKTIKEAQIYSYPFLMMPMLIAATSLSGTGASTEISHYCIPLYNSMQCMIGIFSFELYMPGLIITILVNGLITAVGICVLTKMFNSESIIFSK